MACFHFYIFCINNAQSSNKDQLISIVYIHHIVVFDVDLDYVNLSSINKLRHCKCLHEEKKERKKERVGCCPMRCKGRFNNNKHILLILIYELKSIRANTH